MSRQLVRQTENRIEPSFSSTITHEVPISMGKVAKGEQCSVVGCGASAIRSISSEKVAHTGISIGSARRAYLCKNNYKEFRKLSRKDRQIDKWRFSA
jgi:hypothetical protein